MKSSIPVDSVPKTVLTSSLVVAVELIEDGDTMRDGTFGGKCAEARFRIELNDADGGEFLDELVDADFAVFRELTETGVFVVGKADGECAHDMCFKNWEGVWIFISGKRS